MTPPFFVVGCPRSGTTLLANLLRSHPDLAIPPESHFLPLYYRAWGDPPSERAARRLARRILALHWVRRFELDLAPDDFADCRRYGALVERIYGELVRREGARRWGDKTPGYALHLPTIAEVFPDAQFVHIVRDGRDVACSLIQTRIGPRRVATAAPLWQRYVETAQRDGSALETEHYHEVRYEALLRDPEATLRGVCAFLGAPFDVHVLAPTAIDLDRFPDVFGPRRGRQLSATEIVRENSGHWRRTMTAEEIDRFESVAGDLLVRLGYELGGRGQQPPPGAMEQLAGAAADRLLWAGYQFKRPHKRLWLPGELLFNWARLRARWRAPRAAARDRAASRRSKPRTPRA